MTLEHLNSLAPIAAEKWFESCCTASRWRQMMAENRPYRDIKTLKKQACSAWDEMLEQDILEAFSGHPMIGDIDSLRAKYANTKSMAQGEQGGMQQASDNVLKELKQLNQDYLNKHGFIFIVCATGLSADEMLNAISKRITNSTAQELKTGAQEQLKITLIRIDKALSQTQENNNE